MIYGITLSYPHPYSYREAIDVALVAKQHWVHIIRADFCRKAGAGYGPAQVAVGMSSLELVGVGAPTGLKGMLSRYNSPNQTPYGTPQGSPMVTPVGTPLGTPRRHIARQERRGARTSSEIMAETSDDAMVDASSHGTQIVRLDHTLSLCYYSINELDDAKFYSRQACSMAKRQLGTEIHPDYVAILNTRGLIEAACGDLEAFLLTAGDAMRIRSKVCEM